MPKFVSRFWTPAIRVLLIAVLVALWTARVGAAPNAKGPITIEVDAATIAAANTLGDAVVFYTPRRRPLKDLRDIKTSGTELGIWGLDLINGARSLIESAGGQLGGAGKGLVRGIGDAYFPSLFQENPELRLFITRKYDDHREAAIERTGGGVRVIFKLRSASSAPPDALTKETESKETNARVTASQYIDLAPEDSNAGTIFVEINRSDVPSGWSVSWHFSVYSPKGVRVGLGRIEDSSGPPKALAIRIPSGRHRLEVTRARAEETPITGMFDFNKHEWIPPSDETDVIAAADVAVSQSSVTVATFSYDAPKVLKTERKEGQAALMLARNPRISSHVDKTMPPPTEKAKVHPFVEGGGSFGALDQASVLQQLLGGGDRNEMATTALLKAKSISVDSLVAALGSEASKPSWGLARVAARAQDKRLVEPLLAMLGRTPTDQRAPLYWALGELGDARALSVLSEAATSSPIVGRVYAIFALGRIRNAGAVETLSKAMIDEACTNYESRVTIADPEMNGWYALGGSGWKQIVPLPAFCVRKVAIYSLGQIGGDKALDVLVSLTTSDDEEIRLQACESLSRFRSPAAVRALANRIDDRARVQFIAAAALGAIRTPDAVAALKRFAAEGKDEVTRSIARSALGKMSKP